MQTASFTASLFYHAMQVDWLGVRSLLRSSSVVFLKVDFQSVLCRLNGLFWFFCFENYLRHVPICDVSQRVKLQFLSPAIMDVSFTLGEIEERDFDVATQPGRDNISVCTCTGFCFREAGRNACLCSSAQ